MAPFPEEEIMTIQRLEVALRRSDYKLLKEGAYKLHEKYHSHHNFQYKDLLEKILDEVQANYAIPSDIKDILIPTIQDILSNNEQEQQNRVSSLTSLSYGVNNQTEEQSYGQDSRPQTLRPVEIEPENKSQNEYIKPFQEFTPIRPIDMVPESVAQESKEEFKNYEDNQDSKLIVDSYSEQPGEDFDTQTPVMYQQNIFEENEKEHDVQETKEHFLQEEPIEYLKSKEIQEVEYSKEDEKEIVQEAEIREETQQDSIIEEEPKEVMQKQEDISYSAEIPSETFKDDKEESAEVVNEPEETSKTISMFFGQDSSAEKIRNIAKYHSLIDSHSDFTLREITSLINEIKTQADTNVSELQMFLEQLKGTKHHLSLITNSQSANLTDLLDQSNITYKICDSNIEKRINLIPLFGLTNLYKCIECEDEYLQNNEFNSFILQCPKCKNAMLPDLYSANTETNMDYYNESIVALANSDTWLLIHPSLSEKLTLEMIKTAANISSKIKEIYILDKDINVRETYKKIFEDINPEIKVSSDVNVIGSFLSNI